MPDDTAVSSSTMAEQIKMPFGLWTPLAQGMHSYMGMYIE